MDTAGKREDELRRALTYVHLAVVVVELLSRVQLLRDPMDCSPPGSSVHGILQARVLEWVGISFSRGSSRPTLPCVNWIASGKPCIAQGAQLSTL